MEHLTTMHKLIAESMLFRDLQPEEVAAIGACLRPSAHARGTHILERGQWHGQLYIIATGHVSVLLPKNSTDSQQPGDEQSIAGEHLVARLGPGECFGEMSLITGEPPSATIRAEQNMTLWSLPQTDFVTLVGTCPTLLHNINTILTRRLLRTNQQAISLPKAEILWLSHFLPTSTAPEYKLSYHIATALAWCSHKRVLLLEMCGLDMATLPHFGVHPHQIRPTLLECTHDQFALQAHTAPTVHNGEHIPALTAIAPTQAEALTLDAGLLASLTDLTTHYDYLVLATTHDTPAQFMANIAEHCQRTIFVVTAGSEAQFTMPTSNAEYKNASLFVAQVSEKPTTGLQDRYAATLHHPITRLLPADNTLLKQSWQAQQPLHRLAPRAELTLAVQFLARHIAHQTLGIAFGGGGARGFAHLGVLERLLSHGIPLDYISACSSGIITPGMYLIGKSLLESEEIFLDIQRHLVQWRFPRTSIFSNKGMKHILDQICGDMRFEDLTTPFAMVAVDLTTHAGVILERGPLWQAALASVALPGIFPPIRIGEHLLVDAGMHDPVPTRVIRMMGADILLASELGEQEPPSLASATPWILEAEAAQAHSLQGKKFKKERPPYIVDVLLRSYDIALATVGMHSIREADIVFRPKLHHVSLRQFSEGRKFIAAGREAVEQALPELKKKLPWL